MNNRLYAIDGLRGWGALVVFLFHIFSMICHRGKFSFLDQYFYGTPFEILADGTTAVLLFFMLSGFSLSYKFFKCNGDNQYLRDAAEFRYFRLLIPAFFALFIPYFLIKLNLMFNTKVFIGAYTDQISLYSVLKYAFFDLPFVPFSPHADYNPVLWTIHMEFVASFFIFAFLALFGTSSFRFILYLFFLRFFYSYANYIGFYFLFIAGVIFCDLYLIGQKLDKATTEAASNFISKWANKKIGSIISIALLIYAYNHFVAHHHRFYFTKSNYLFLIFFFACFLYVPVINNFFTTKLSRFLGRISYSLYLVHFPILCSLSSFIYNILTDAGYSSLSIALIVFFITTLITFYIAYFFTIYVEESLLPAMRYKLKEISELIGAKSSFKLEFEES